MKFATPKSAWNRFCRAPLNSACLKPWETTRPAFNFQSWCFLNNPTAHSISHYCGKKTWVSDGQWYLIWMMKIVWYPCYPSRKSCPTRYSYEGRDGSPVAVSCRLRARLVLESPTALRSTWRLQRRTPPITVRLLRANFRCRKKNTDGFPWTQGQVISLEELDSLLLTHPSA